jgi:hypothetical protein
MSKHIYLSDVVSDRASVSFRFSIRDLIPISGRACSGFRLGPRLGLARDLTQPGPWRVPLAPHLPPRALPLSISFLFPAQQLPLPLSHISSTSLP